MMTVMVVKMTALKPGTQPHCCTLPTTPCIATHGYSGGGGYKGLGKAGECVA